MTRKISTEMEVVPTVSWYSELVFACFIPTQWPWVLASCEHFPPPAVACCISPHFTPDATRSRVPPAPSLLPTPRIPPCPPASVGNPSVTSIPVCPSGEAQPPALSHSPQYLPSLAPSGTPGYPGDSRLCRGTWWSFAPTRHCISWHAAACCFPAIAKSQFSLRQNKAALDFRNNRLQP